jgi:hypothetical protein
MISEQETGMDTVVASRVAEVRGWRRWAPYAAVAWSLVYAALGVYWASGGPGFPYTTETTQMDGLGPVIGRLGPTAVWIVVAVAGIPAAGMGAAMAAGVRARRSDLSSWLPEGCWRRSSCCS